MDVVAIGGVMAVATMFGQVLVRTKLPQTLVSMITGAVSSRGMFIFLITMLLIFLGMLLEGSVIIVVVTPMLLNVLPAYDISLVEFGILLLMANTLGALTPPYGMTTFITSRVMGMPMMKLAKAMIPWMIALLGVVLTIAYYPSIVTWLPRIMGYPV